MKPENIITVVYAMAAGRKIEQKIMSVGGWIWKILPNGEAPDFNAEYRIAE